METDREMVVAQLELIAAKAKTLAMEVRDGKLWEGELASGMGVIAGALESARNTEYYRRDRRG